MEIHVITWFYMVSYNYLYKIKRNNEVKKGCNVV
jgi:hypothetical protein